MDALDTISLVILVFSGNVLSVKVENGGTYFTIDVKFSDAYCSDESKVQDDVKSDLFCAHRCSGNESCKGFFYNSIASLCSTVNQVPEGANECEAQDGSVFYKLLDCGAAPVVNNSALQSTEGDGTPGTVLTYSCEDGYGSPTNKNNYTVTCQNSRYWTDVGFECKKECSEPSPIEHATLNTGNSLNAETPLVGTVRAYTCAENYVTAMGSNTISRTCTDTGEWTTPAETCLRDCGTAPVVNNSVLESTQGVGTQGTVLTYSCEDGYRSPTNDYTVTCQISGLWTDVGFECRKDCSEPSTIDYATLDVGDTLEGTVRTHTCLDNYISHYESKTVSVSCTDTGEWTQPGICFGTCKLSHELVTGPEGISDEKISATSFDDSLNNKPWYGRLDNDSSWIATDDTSQQHIQFEFAKAMIVNEIITQGCGCNDDITWVITYKIAYSTDCGNFTEYEYKQLFNGNGDIDDKVSNEIFPPITAKCIRVLPMAYYDYIGMRVELMGCSP